MRQKLKGTPLLMILFKDINLLEHDAATQYRFNRFWAILWGFTMMPVIFSIVRYIIERKLGPVTEDLILLVSLWANFATHFGAMSAALAAKNTTKVVKDVADNIGDATDNIGDIQEDVGKIADIVVR